jgi:hypothetical protein
MAFAIVEIFLLSQAAGVVRTGQQGYPPDHRSALLLATISGNSTPYNQEVTACRRKPILPVNYPFQCCPTLTAMTKSVLPERAVSKRRGCRPTVKRQ